MVRMKSLDGKWKDGMWKSLDSMNSILKGKCYRKNAWVQLRVSNTTLGIITEIDNNGRCKVDWKDGPKDSLANMDKNAWFSLSKLN